MKCKKNSVLHLAVVMTKVLNVLKENGAYLNNKTIVIEKNGHGMLQTQVTVALQHKC